MATKRRSHKKMKTKTRTVMVHPKRSHRRKRSRGLAAGVNQAAIMGSLKSAGAGAIGGYLASVTNRMIPGSLGTLGRIGIGVLGGAAVNTFLQMPNVASGWVGGYVALNNVKGMAEDVEFAEDDILSEEPMYLSEDGIPLTLNEDGSYSYMGEE